MRRLKPLLQRAAIISDKPSSQTTSSMLKEQFALIGVVVVIIGTVYTDYYYASFGLRYQSLGLPASHILYRGLTVLRDAPYVAIPYLLAAIWLTIDDRTKSSWLVPNRLLISYILMVAVLFLSYLLASIAGQRAGAHDLSVNSSLPKIKTLVTSGGTETPCSTADACRLLLIDSDYIYVFVPATCSSAVPNIIRLEKKEFNEVSTATQ
jgi:hypothetical protein